MATSFVVRATHAFDGQRFVPEGLQVQVQDDRIVAVRPAHAPLPVGLPVLDRPNATLLPAFYVPTRLGHTQRSLNQPVSCHLGFSYDGLRAWSVRNA